MWWASVSQTLPHWTAVMSFCVPLSLSLCRPSLGLSSSSPYLFIRLSPHLCTSFLCLSSSFCLLLSPISDRASAEAVMFSNPRLQACFSAHTSNTHTHTGEKRMLSSSNWRDLLLFSSYATRFIQFEVSCRWFLFIPHCLILLVLRPLCFPASVIFLLHFFWSSLSAASC